MIVTEFEAETKLDKEIVGPNNRPIIFAVEYDREKQEFFPSVTEEFDTCEFFGKLVAMIAVMHEAAHKKEKGIENERKTDH